MKANYIFSNAHHSTLSYLAFLVGSLSSHLHSSTIVLAHAAEKLPLLPILILTFSGCLGQFLLLIPAETAASSLIASTPSLGRMPTSVLPYVGLYQWWPKKLLNLAHSSFFRVGDTLANKVADLPKVPRKLHASCVTTYNKSGKSLMLGWAAVMLVVQGSRSGFAGGSADEWQSSSQQANFYPSHQQPSPAVIYKKLAIEVAKRITTEIQKT